MSLHVCLVAGEDSGDALGADVIDALRKLDPAIRISVIGGSQMRKRGVPLDVDMSGLAVLGLLEGLRVFGRVRRAVAQAASAIEASRPDAVILIDSWGFMWRLARALKRSGVGAKRIKLIGPQVWATRPGRARVLAQWTDHLLCIHAFEEPFYRRWNLPTTVIGNPALSRLPKGDAAAFRVRHGIAPGAPVVGVLPGSRRSEIRRVAPILFAAAGRLKTGATSRRVICVEAASVKADLSALLASLAYQVTPIQEDEKADAFAAMDVALACSGTVTTEVAAQGSPLVVGYKLGWVTWAIARLFLMRSRFITLLNVAAGREVAPEFVQTRFTPAKVAAAAEHILSSREVSERQRREQFEALAAMQTENGTPAAEVAAGAILRIAGS